MYYVTLVLTEDSIGSAIFGGIGAYRSHLMNGINCHRADDIKHIITLAI